MEKSFQLPLEGDTESDITRKLITSDFIYENIYNLFPDSLFLNARMEILGLSITLQRSLGYSSQEINGQSISKLGDGLDSMLQYSLRNGFFEGQQFTIRKKSGVEVPFMVSGFYLGILTEGSGVIVLRFVNRNEVEDLDRKLTQTRSHIDHFIYRTAHDLRGPLATVQGLVNLLKMRTDDADVDRFISLIDVNTRKLDERLYQLVYLAKVEEQFEPPRLRLDFGALETKLRRLIEQNAFVDFLELFVHRERELTVGFDELSVEGILANLILYTLSLRKCWPNVVVKIEARCEFDRLMLSVLTEGFQPDPEIQMVMDNEEVNQYAGLLRSPKFTYLFAAQKIALQSKTVISVDKVTESSQRFSVVIPRAITA